MHPIKPVQRWPSCSINLIRSISSHSAPNPPPTTQADQDARRKADWEKFAPTATQLIETFGAFYNRSTDLSAAERWEHLKSQGYRPVKRSKVSFRWWHEERQRGRIQPDHEQSYPLFITQNYSPESTSHPQTKKQGSPFQAPAGQRRHFILSEPSRRHSLTQSFDRHIRPKTPILHKNSPDIIDVVGDAAAFHIPDVDYTSFDSESGTDDLSRHLGQSPGAKGIRGLRPGSLLELRRTNQSELGILVRTQGAGVLYVNRAGEIRMSILDNVMYTIHGVVSEEVAMRTHDESLSFEGLNDTVISSTSSELSPEEVNSKAEVLINARRDCCRALRALDKKLDKAHSMLTKAGSYSIYDQFKNLDPRKPAYLTSEQGVERLLGKQYVNDEIMVFALHQQLMANADMFLAIARDLRDGSRFLVQPFHTLHALYTVRELIAQNLPPLKTFVGKCQTVIQAYRRQQASTLPDTRLSYGSATPPHWDSTDRMFIEVFQTIATNQRMIQDQPYSAVAASILKEIGLYDAEAMTKTWPSLTFDRFGAITLLRDLGILPAWQSVGLWNPDLDLTERISQQLKLNDQPSESTVKTLPSGTPSTSKSTRATHTRAATSALVDDPADSLRHDFRDLPVYIIDDPGAQELDDGISIEFINQGSSEAWIHVHIADPTAHLKPSDEIALRARAFLDTIYLPGFTLPMLPSTFIESRKMSLGSSDKSSGLVGQKTLSFSARIGANGEILEYKVRPGWINNPKQVTYQVISKILDGSKCSGQVRVIHVGPDADQISLTETNSQRNLTIEELGQDDHQRINELGRISAVLTRRRVKDGAIGWNLPMAEVSVQPNRIVSPSLGIPAAPRLIAGTPSLSISLPAKITDYKNHPWGMSSAQMLVSEMMLMAGRLAGRFYADQRAHNPFHLTFRSQPPPDLGGSAHNPEALKQLREQIDRNTGMLSPFKFQKARIMFNPAVNGLEPMNHFPLGINDSYGYCKVTSPLRRYSDLVCHWQIKNAILRSGGKQTYEDQRKFLSLDGMKELVGRLDRDTKPMVNLDRKMNLSWMSYVLRRVMNGPEKKPSMKIRGDGEEMEFGVLVNGNLTAIILQDPVLMRFTNRWSFKAYIPELGLRASLIVDEVQDWFAGWVDHHHRPNVSSPQPPQSDLDPVGLRVPVHIVYINPEDHLILRLDPNRPDFVIQSIA